MSKDNGQVRTVSTVLREVRESVEVDDGTVLSDMSGNMEGIRRFLIGGQRDDGIWPAGGIFVNREGRDVVLRLSIRSLEVEAIYRDYSWHGMWDTVDTDLRENTVRWHRDYKGRQREERRWTEPEKSA